MEGELWSLIHPLACSARENLMPSDVLAYMNPTSRARMESARCIITPWLFNAGLADWDQGRPLYPGPPRWRPAMGRVCGVLLRTRKTRLRRPQIAAESWQAVRQYRRETAVIGNYVVGTYRRMRYADRAESGRSRHEARSSIAMARFQLLSVVDWQTTDEALRHVSSGG